MPIIDFDIESYEPSKPKNFDPLPPGKYSVVISDSQMKVTKAGTGEYLELTMLVLDAQYAGRKLWERLNVKNASKVAEEIARSQLNAIKEACGLYGKLQDTEQLHDTPFEVQLEIDRRDPTRNKIVGYAQIVKSEPEKKTAAKPWERK